MVTSGLDKSDGTVPQGRTVPSEAFKKAQCAYFCQVRFLCRLRRNFFRRLCLLILAFRRFFREPIALI